LEAKAEAEANARSGRKEVVNARKYVVNGCGLLLLRVLARGGADAEAVVIAFACCWASCWGKDQIDALLHFGTAICLCRKASLCKR